MKRRRHMRRLVLATVLILSAACQSPAGPAALSPLRIVARDSALQLENLSSEPVFYFVYERQAAALIDWTPCVGQSCPSLAGHAKTGVPYATIGGYAPGKTEAIVWWWRSVPGAADAPAPGLV